MSDVDNEVNFTEWADEEFREIKIKYSELQKAYFEYKSYDKELCNMLTGLENKQFIEFVRDNEKNIEIKNSIIACIIEYEDLYHKIMPGTWSEGFGAKNWDDLATKETEIFSKIDKERQKLKLLRVNETMQKAQKTQEPEQAQEINISKIIWNGKIADLARIYKDLLNAGMITISGRAFSKHFNNKNGKPLSPDFLENKTTNQNDISSDQTIQTLQNLIRVMKPESGE